MRYIIARPNGLVKFLSVDEARKGAAKASEGWGGDFVIYEIRPVEFCKGPEMTGEKKA